MQRQCTRLRIIPASVCMTALFSVSQLSAQMESVPADDGKSMIGRNFMPRMVSTFYASDRRTISEDSPGMPYIVDEISGEWCRVRRWWIRSSELISLEAAPAYYTEQLRNGHDPLSVFCLRGHAWYERGEYQLAAFDYSDGIRISKDNEQLFRYRAKAEYAAGKTENAISDLRKAIELRPSYELSTLELAWLLSTCPDDRHRDPETALRLLATVKDATRVDPYPSRVFAAAFAAAGRWDDAVSAQEKALDGMTKKGWKENRLIPAKQRLEMFRHRKIYIDTKRTLDWHTPNRPN